MEPRENLTGKTFGQIVVLSYSGFIRRGKRRNFWLVRCECGTEKIARSDSVKKGRGCGCGHPLYSHRHTSKKNGRSTSEYRSWKSMKERCCRSAHHAFERYGGRGIKVCDRWLASFENFLDDMGPKPSPKHSIDRYPDNDGNYEPGNVRWATRKEQANNRRPRRITRGCKA